VFRICVLLSTSGVGMSLEAILSDLINRLLDYCCYRSSILAEAQVVSIWEMDAPERGFRVRR